jgi:hypothetical protein
LELQAHFAIALRALDPVIIAYRRYQHYYPPDHGIITPQSSSKKHLALQGENIKHEHWKHLNFEILSLHCMDFMIGK